MKRTLGHAPVLLMALLLCSGCGTTYQAPSVQHIYTTSTQEAHELSGVSIRFDDANRLIMGVMEGVAGARTQMVYFIDGREVFRHPKSGSFESFVQLPPGNHELLIVEEISAAATFGKNDSEWRQKYRFKLKQGETALIQGTRNPGGLYGAAYGLNGFESLTLVESVDWNGARLPDSRTFTSDVTRAAPTKSSHEEKLWALKDLHAKGLISDEDFLREKALILRALVSDNQKPPR